MIHRNTLKHSLFTTAGIIILTLTGIFSTLAGRPVIEGVLDLSTVVLVLMIGGTAYLVAMQAREKGIVPAVINGLVGGGIVGMALALLVIIESNVDLRFVFQNLRSLNGSTLTAGQRISLPDGEIDGLLTMLAFSVGLGALVGLLVNLPTRIREMLLLSAGLTVVIGLVGRQINNIITLPDALALLVVFASAYIGARFFLPFKMQMRLGAGLAIGIVIGIVIALIASSGGLESGGILRGPRGMPVILEMTITGAVLPFILILGAVGIAGVLVSGASRSIHDGSVYFVVSLLVLAILHWQRMMTSTAAALIFVLIALLLWFVRLLGRDADAAFELRTPDEQRDIRRMIFFGTLLVLLVAPQFMGLYISNVFNLIALYAVMGIGLNVMIGYTGLLDLGYVASFAIGAYTLGILTTPNIITCGGVNPGQIPLADIPQVCTGVMTFWTAWPVCVLFSGVTGMMLGIPVLRLRGDYLAIVTLGFGEIIHRIILSNDFRPILGGAQGITPIPSPVINLTGLNPQWQASLNNSTSIYYLFLFSLLVAAFVVSQLANSRTGRAWRAIRSDEDVAQAVGINLVRYKLLAFGISSAFAGLGGAAFGASVQGIFPNSFTLLVSINVLSLIIIGGMGSIPGVIVGALILIGLPEVLRELDAYRLLAFGALLVTVMLVKPEGLLPPKAPQLSELAGEYRHQRREEEVSRV